MQLALPYILPDDEPLSSIGRDAGRELIPGHAAFKPRLHPIHQPRTHRCVGHLFQGHFKGILVQKEAYLLELARYMVLAPVRAGLVAELKD